MGNWEKKSAFGMSWDVEKRKEGNLVLFLVSAVLGTLVVYIVFPWGFCGNVPLCLKTIIMSGNFHEIYGHIKISFLNDKKLS